METQSRGHKKKSPGLNADTETEDTPHTNLQIELLLLLLFCCGVRGNSAVGPLPSRPPLRPFRSPA